MFDKLILMSPHTHSFTKTLYGFKRFYGETSPTSWPEMFFTANLKPFTYEEYVELLNKVLDLQKQFEGSAIIEKIITNPPPSQDYKMFLGVFKSGGDLKSAGEADSESFNSAQKHWEETRNEYNNLTKELFDNNNYLQLQVFPKEKYDSNTCWWYFIKEDPYTISIKLYPKIKGQSKLAIETLMKPSLRYRLGCL